MSYTTKTKQKTLYVSDLDGTLLNQDARLSEYSHRGLEYLLHSGVSFVPASARSIHSIRPLFQGLELPLPAIELNGAALTDIGTGERLLVQSIDCNLLEEISDKLKKRNLEYLVSCLEGNVDRLYYQNNPNHGFQWYLQDLMSRNDPRLRKIPNLKDVEPLPTLALIVIDQKEQLREIYLELKEDPNLQVHLQENQYSPGWFWLTIQSAMATKDQAIRELQRIYNLQEAKITVFGDGDNDLKMMSYAQHAVAVANANAAVKKAAHQTIGSNREDAVIKYILTAEGLSL